MVHIVHSRGGDNYCGMCPLATEEEPTLVILFMGATCSNRLLGDKSLKREYPVSSGPIIVNGVFLSG